MTAENTIDYRRLINDKVLDRWAVISLIASIVVLCAFRLVTAYNYQAVYVGIGQIPADVKSIQLFAMNADQQFIALLKLQGSGQVMGKKIGWTPVTGLVVVGEDLRVDHLQGLFDVRVGVGWDSADRLTVSRITELSDDGDEAPDVLRNLGDRRSFLVELTGFRSSLLPWNRGVVNWGGDFWVLAVGCLQGAAAWLLCMVAVRGLQRIAGGEERASGTGSEESLAGKVFAELLRLVAILFVGTLCWQWASTLLKLRAAEQLSAGLAATIVVGGLIWGWLRVVDRTVSDRMLYLKMALLTLSVLGLKLWWLSTVEFRPFSDYADYHRYGAQMAAGDWEAIRNGPEGLAAIFLRRATTFALPISLAFGSSISAYEYVNCGMQAMTILLFCVLVGRIGGKRSAAYSLPFLLIYPEYWYLPGVTTQNIVGYFWMVVFWLIVEVFLRSSTGFKERGFGLFVRIGVACGFGVAAGVVCGVIELCKSYGIFMLLSVFLCLFCWRLLPRSVLNERRCLQSAGGAKVWFVIVLVLTYRLLVGGVDRYLLERSERRVPPYWTPIVLAAIDSTTNGSGEAFSIWATQYAYAATPSHLGELLFRKLLHEKVGAGVEFLKSLFRKTVVLAMPADSMSLVQDNLRTANGTAEPENVALGTMQYTMCHGLMLIPGLLFLLRLTAPGPLIRSESELFPMVSCWVLLAVVLLLAEAHPYTGLNFMFPLCWSAGVILDRSRLADSDQAAGVGTVFRCLFPVSRGVAAGVMVAGAGLFCLLGNSVDHSGATFHQVAMLETTAVSDAAADRSQSTALKTAVAGTARVRCWLELKPTAAISRKGELARQDFRVTSEGGPLEELRFFVTGNQHARRVRIRDGWKGQPLRYSVAINGREILSDRPLEELSRPVFRTFSASDWGGDQGASQQSVVVTLILKCEDECSIGRIQPVPAIALEYFH